MADLRKVVIDGLTIDVTDQGAQAIEKLQKQLTDADKARSDLETQHQEAIAAKDKEIATKDGEIDKLKGEVMDAEALDKAVTERADLIGKAKAIADEDYSGKSPADIRKAAVVAKLGDEAIKDKSDAYIEARFDVLCEDAANTDPVRSALNSQAHNDAKPNDNGYDGYVQSLTDAWKGSNQKEVS